MSTPTNHVQFTQSTLHTPEATATEDIEAQTPGSATKFLFDEKHHDDGFETIPDRPKTPKYSARWWDKTWDKLVREATWPRVMYSMLLLVLLGIWLGIMIAFGKAETKYEKINANLLPVVHPTGNGDSNNTYDGAIMLKGTLVNFDPSSRSLTVTWSGLYRDGDDPEPAPLGNKSDVNSYWAGGLGVYRDLDSIPMFFPAIANNTMWNGSAATEYPDIPDWNNTGELGIWDYAIDNTTALPIAVIGQHVWDSFDTDISFSQVDSNPMRIPLFGYPFDRWSGEIVFVVNTILGARDWYNSSTTAVLRLSGAQLADSTLNWRFNMEWTDTCKGSEMDPLNRSTFADNCHLDIKLTARRPGLVIFAAIIAVIVNWLSTILVFILTCESIVMRRGYMLEGTDLLSVCFTALFALPSVRSLLPGAPDFGALIDLVGIIPNVIIISLCTIVVCVAKLYRSPEHEERREIRRAEKEGKDE